MAALAYVEVWSDLPGAGGVLLGRLPAPVEAEDQCSVDGRETASASWAKSHPTVATLAIRGRVARFVFDDTTFTEWDIHQTSITSGHGDLLYRIACTGIADRLNRFDIRLVDGDGFVFFDVPAFQQDPADILSDWILADAPPWLVPGGVDETELQEIQFSKDTGLSGTIKLATQLGKEWWLKQGAGDTYELHIGVRGTGATSPRLRAGGNLIRVTRTVGGDQITRIRPVGASGDDPGPSTLAWAYWEVTAVAGDLITLGPIHQSGPGPIAFDDQFNHAQLGFTAYLERRNGTKTAITDSIAATQQLEVADPTNIAVGHWVRIVASSAGEHLVRLDAPPAIASEGVHLGEYNSPWDDTVNLLGNAIMQRHTNPAGAADGITTVVGTFSRETDPALCLPGLGVSCMKVERDSGSAESILFHRSEPHYIHPRKAILSATVIQRMTARTKGRLRVRILVDGNPVGEPLYYENPLNQWKDLRLEGVSLAPFAGAVHNVGIEVAGVTDPSNTGFTATFYVAAWQLSFTQTARPITWGSNPARSWQNALTFMRQRMGTPETFGLEVLDHARAGLSMHAPFALGAWGPLDCDELGIAGLSVRIVGRRRDLRRERLTALTVTTAPIHLPKRLSAPKPLEFPFFEPVRSTLANRDARQAAQLLRARVTAVTKTTLTVALDHVDLLGGTPTIVATPLGGATIASGSGLGPYVINKPGLGGGGGRVLFTAQIPGRTDVIDAVDVPESSYAALQIRIVPTNATVLEVTVRVYVFSPGTNGVGVSLSYTKQPAGFGVSPGSPQSMTANATFATTNYVEFTLSRLAFGGGGSTVTFVAAASGFIDGQHTIDVESIANLASAVKTMRIHPSAGGEASGQPSQIASDGTVRSVTTPLVLERRYYPLDALPENVLITEIQAEVYGASNTVQVFLRKQGGTTVGSGLLSPSASYQTLTEALNESVGSNRYYIDVLFNGGSTVDDRRIRDLKIKYTSPNLQAVT